MNNRIVYPSGPIVLMGLGVLIIIAGTYTNYQFSIWLVGAALFTMNDAYWIEVKMLTTKNYLSQVSEKELYSIRLIPLNLIFGSFLVLIICSILYNVKGFDSKFIWRMLSWMILFLIPCAANFFYLDRLIKKKELNPIEVLGSAGKGKEVTLNYGEIKLKKEAIIEFENLLKRYQFNVVNNEIILFWQPWVTEEDVEAKLESILECNGIEIDTHCYLSEERDFDEGVRFFKNMT